MKYQGLDSEFNTYLINHPNEIKVARRKIQIRYRIYTLPRNRSTNASRPIMNCRWYSN